MIKPLSPAAKAVLDAAGLRYAIDSDLQDTIAAAFRAAAKQSTFADVAVLDLHSPVLRKETIEVVPVDVLLAIADELEVQ